MLHQLVVNRGVSHTLTSFLTSENAADLAELAGLLESGEVRPAVDRTYGLDEVPAALARLLAGQARGRLVVRP